MLITSNSTSTVHQKYLKSTKKPATSIHKSLLTNFVALQVLASEAWAGEGARLPLQDYDLRPQPADQQLLTARLVLLENHQSTV